MIVLAVDTTSAFGSVAVRRDGETVAELPLESTDGYGHLLFAAVEQVLAIAGISVQQVDCFAAAAGPGAFTGVRVGLATVKGLAHALNKPARGVSNLRALATAGATSRRAVILDARRGDVFAAIYDGQLRCVSPEVVAPLASWLAHLEVPPDEWIGTADWSAHLPPGAPFVTAPHHLAPAVARCAQLDLAEGVYADPAGPDANYVRRSDAELAWRDGP